MPQASKNKIKRGNLNKKDHARNMRGVRKYEDKINFIIKHNVDVAHIDNKKVLDGIKGDREFAATKDLSREPKINVNDDSHVYDEEDDTKPESSHSSYLDKKLKEYLPKDVSDTESFKIIFENERILIIDKPAGIMVHPDDKSNEVTISDIVYAQYPDMRTVGEGDRYGIVHRLDRNTTGCLVLCKTQDAHKDMKNIFKAHKVRKVYRAIVEGNVRDDMGVIDKPMARTRSDFRKKGVVDMFSKDFRGAERTAITRYKVLARSKDKKHTYVELYPLTGRTHQLRVHMRSIRHPIIGDDLYGSEKGKLESGRSMLHAYKIEFTLRKQEIKATAEVPQDMQDILDKFFI